MDIQVLVSELKTELIEHILPFWMKKMPDPRGGFYGEIDGCGRARPDVPKGNILNARILWTFSAVHRFFPEPEYKAMAERAYKEIREKFVDFEYGGMYWTLTPDGAPMDTKKQFFALAFAVYALSEYYMAFKDEEALELAVSIYSTIEKYGRAPGSSGYIEAMTRDWQPIADRRLSERDRNDAKTMNTHLHLLEAYTNFYRVWKDDGLRGRLADLVNIFLDKIVQSDNHLGLFFDEDWNLQSEMRSYGHDIETSWLLCEAVDLLEDEALKERARLVCKKMFEAGMEGYTKGEGLIYEWDPVSGHKDSSRQWWVQAEAVVACMTQYRQSGEQYHIDCAFDIWDFIKKNLLSPEGEWYCGVNSEGDVNPEDVLAGFWKCPYHNSRMCLELMFK